MSILGLSLTRSNGAALVVTLASAFLLAALLWSPDASTQQSAGSISLPFPAPLRDPPRDPDGAPARVRIGVAAGARVCAPPGRRP